MTEAAQIERGDWVTIPTRYSTSMRYLIPPIRGIVRSMRPNRNEIDVIEFKTHSTRTCRLDTAELMRGRSKMVEKHIQEIQDIPRFRSPGNRDLTEEVNEATLGEIVVDRYIAKLKQKRNKQMAAKKTGKGEAKTDAPKKARRGKATLAGVQPDDFFTENGKGKSVFRPGHDAKFAGCIKRIANGTADADDKRIAKSKVMLNHPKVAESAHFQHLLKEAAKASA